MRALPCIALIALALPAMAQTRYFHVQSGTGFFVNDDGYLLTNHHVVTGCTQVTLKGTDFPETTADVRAIDEAHDLALIYVKATPPGTARLRDNIDDMNPGDHVLTVGYPGDAWKTGQYTLSDASLVDTKGPHDHPDWIQFSDSVHHGNSGGPLLDSSGNVIGVVVAKMVQTLGKYEVNRVTGEKKLLETEQLNSDAAIGLPTVEAFLDSQHVGYRSSISGVTAGDFSIERIVRDYTVNVQCRLPAQ